ncbi:MAG: baseplate J/gp47 family protein [Rhodospirillales bacterium]|nr:baseplate J/gp47 family protein [Rhodospirillales bacterium]
MPIVTASGFARPTFDELLAARRAGYQGKFGDSPADGVNARLAELDAEMLHALYAYIEYEAQQFMPMHATGTRLLEWGTFLIGAPKAATAAAGTTRFPGTDGTEVPALLRLTRDDGAEFEVVTGGIVAAGAVDVPVRALTAGAAGNTVAAAVLTPVNPVLGLAGTGSVLAPGLTGGADAETEDAYRARYLVRLREPPAGGNDTDHVSWMLEVAGVTRGWVRRGAAGTGEIVLLFMEDDTYANGIPVGDGAPNYSGDLKRVYDYVETKAPSPGVRYVKAPIAKVVDVTINGLSPDTPEVRAAIEAELDDLFRRRARPGGVMRYSWFGEAVSVATGEDGFDAITSPALSVICEEDEIAIRGEVTYEP